MAEVQHMTEELTLYVIIILESTGMIRTLNTKNIHEDEGFTWPVNPSTLRRLEGTL